MNRLVDWVTSHITAAIDRAIAWINELNTTNLRLLVTIACVAATCIVYLALAVFHVVRAFVIGVDVKAGPLWTPAVEWLTFLATMSGVDTLQHYLKRKTFKTPGEMAAVPAPPTGPAPRPSGSSPAA